MERLVQLFHRRWAVPVLAELHRLDGAKFVQLEHRLGVSGTMLRLTLDDLVERGLVRPNPGYGHPLRPEYILAAPARGLAEHCAALDDHLARVDLTDIGLRKWSMPVLYVVGHGAERFGQVVDQLGAATDRAVALSLKDLAGVSLVSRSLVAAYPPIARYSATRRADRLVTVLDALAQC